MPAFSWRSRVISRDGAPAHVLVRRHRFSVDRPIAFDMEQGELAALDYALGALGAEVVTGLRAFAKRRRIALDRIEAVVDGELENALLYLEVIGETGGPALTRVRIKLYLESPHAREILVQLLDDTLKRLPLVQTFAAAVDVQLSLTATA